MLNYALMTEYKRKENLNFIILNKSNQKINRKKIRLIF